MVSIFALAHRCLSITSYTTQKRKNNTTAMTPISNGAERLDAGALAPTEYRKMAIHAIAKDTIDAIKPISTN